MKYSLLTLRKDVLVSVRSPLQADFLTHPGCTVTEGRLPSHVRNRGGSSESHSRSSGCLASPTPSLTHIGVARMTLTTGRVYFMLNVWCQGSLPLLLSTYVSETDKKLCYLIKTKLISIPTWKLTISEKKIKEHKHTCKQ